MLDLCNMVLECLPLWGLRNLKGSRFEFLQILSRSIVLSKFCCCPTQRLLVGGLSRKDNNREVTEQRAAMVHVARKLHQQGLLRTLTTMAGDRALVAPCGRFDAAAAPLLLSLQGSHQSE